MLIKKFMKQVNTLLPKYVEAISTNRYDPVILIKKKYMNKVLFFLKNNVLSQFKTLIDIVSFDTLSNNRFRLTYNILSTKYSLRILMHYKIKGSQPSVKTVTNLYDSGD